MTNDALELASVLVAQIWRFLTSWKIPGFFFTPAQLIMFSLVFPLIIRFVAELLTVSVSTDTSKDKK